MCAVTKLIYLRKGLFFSQQCSLVRNNSTLPILSYFRNERLSNIRLTTDDIIPLIRSLNPNKATGSDGISSQMLSLCDESVVLPHILQQYTTNWYLPIYLESSKCYPYF